MTQLDTTEQLTLSLFKFQEELQGEKGEQLGPRLQKVWLPADFEPHYTLTVIHSVQLLSPVQLPATPWIAAHQASLSIINSQSLLKLMSIKPVMPSSHLIFRHPPDFLPPIPPRIRVFSYESTLCMRWPKYWRFSFSISPSNEHPGLIPFRIDCDTLAYAKYTLLYTEYIMRNTGLGETQAGIKILGEISITSDMQMTPPLWQKTKRN